MNLTHLIRGSREIRYFLFEQEVFNTAARLRVSKQDLTNGQEIPGATLRIVEKETGKIVDTWISEEIPHTVSGLRLSGTEEYRYLLQETIPALGFVTAEEMEFRLIQDRDESGPVAEPQQCADAETTGRSGSLDVSGRKYAGYEG